jgi:sec-independent protein translocase protein TatA
MGGTVSDLKGHGEQSLYGRTPVARRRVGVAAGLRSERQAGLVHTKGSTVHNVLAEIIGPDLIIVLVIVALLFGSSQIPKLARSLGQAHKEFRDGLSEGARDDVEGEKKS